MIQSIRAAQERWRSETQSYLNVSSSMTTYYPMLTPGRTVYDWRQPAHTDYARWRLLNPTVSGPVQFGYSVMAGSPGTTPDELDITDAPDFSAATDPWYVIQATANADGDDDFAKYAATSFSTEVYAENDGE
jgi:hypothetical protein